MATHIDAFAIGGTTIQLSDTTYTEKYSSVEYTQTTEAGTRHRDAIRVGYLAELSVSLTTIGTVKTTFDTAAASDSVTLTIWSDSANESKTWTCYVSSYSASLVRDTTSNTYWEIDITFTDLEAS